MLCNQRLPHQDGWLLWSASDDPPAARLASLSRLWNRGGCGRLSAARIATGDDFSLGQRPGTLSRQAPPASALWMVAQQPARGWNSWSEWAQEVPSKAWLSLQDRPSFAGMAGVLAQAPRVPSRKHEANGIASKRWRSSRIRPSLRGHLPVAPPGFADTPWSELAAERQAARLSAAAASGQQKSQAAKDVIPGANLAMQCIDARPDPYPAAAGCRNETWLARVEISRARLRPT